jgi:cobalt/nickel transport system permease protein
MAIRERPTADSKGLFGTIRPLRRQIMLAIDGSFLDFKQLDRLAMRQTPVHLLDPRAKVLTTICFILCVVSFGRYEISAMLPFLVYPVILMAIGELPSGYILGKIAIVIPFALVIGIFNPIFDRQVLMQLGPLDIWGGWISYISILLRAILTASVAIILVAITGFPAICKALEKLGMPKVFAVQLLFLYRYIFVLTDEGVRTARARQLRTFGRRGFGIRQYGSMIGHLLLRTWDRAERIHMAMLARGFAGEFHTTRPPSQFARAEWFFMGGWIAIFILFRLCNAPQLLGGVFTGTVP